VPGFLFKRDVIPGDVNEFEVVPEEVGGVYRGQCAEFCGLNHAFMDFTVRTVSPEAFSAWIAERSAPPTATPPTSAPAESPS
jgi:cytochrome c oxidase subunit 2